MCTVDMYLGLLAENSTVTLGNNLGGLLIYSVSKAAISSEHTEGLKVLVNYP